jgi:hypothetical protein
MISTSLRNNHDELNKIPVSVKASINSPESLILAAREKYFQTVYEPINPKNVENKVKAILQKGGSISFVMGPQTSPYHGFLLIEGENGKKMALGGYPYKTGPLGVPTDYRFSVVEESTIPPIKDLRIIKSINVSNGEDASLIAKTLSNYVSKSILPAKDRPYKATEPGVYNLLYNNCLHFAGGAVDEVNRVLQEKPKNF